MKLTQEERQMLSKELKNLIDSEISRSNLVNAIRKDGGRIMCETIFLNLINTIFESKSQKIESETEKRVIERMKKMLQEPEEWYLQHHGYATNEQEEEIYKEGMEAMRIYKIIKLLGLQNNNK